MKQITYFLFVDDTLVFYKDSKEQNTYVGFWLGLKLSQV